jgi:hypothetical protein
VLNYIALAISWVGNAQQESDYGAKSAGDIMLTAAFLLGESYIRCRPL